MKIFTDEFKEHVIGGSIDGDTPQEIEDKKEVIILKWLKVAVIAIIVFAIINALFADTPVKRISKFYPGGFSTQVPVKQVLDENFIETSWESKGDDIAVFDGKTYSGDLVRLEIYIKDDYLNVEYYFLNAFDQGSVRGNELIYYLYKNYNNN